MEEILNRLDALERNLATLIQSQGASPESDWVDSKEFCRLVGLKDTKALVYQMSKGILHGPAIRNIGTPPTASVSVPPHQGGQPIPEPRSEAQRLTVFQYFSSALPCHARY